MSVVLRQSHGQDGTYGFCIVEQGDVDPGEVQKGGIPILQDSESCDDVQ